MSHSRFRPGTAKPVLPDKTSLPVPATQSNHEGASSAAADLPEDAADKLEAYHDALEALAASSAAGKILEASKSLMHML